MRKLDRWTAIASAALLFGALLACKKKEEAPPPVASEAPPPPEPPKEEPKKEEPKSDEVKRYGSKEQEERGTVKIRVHHAKVYNDADETMEHEATLSYGTLVNRKARMGNWMLIDYPSGPGELSPGWILTKHLTTVILKINPEDVKKQDAGVVKNPDAGKPATKDAGKPVDAGKPATPDAGKPATPDAGKKPPRLKLPPRPFKIPTKK